MRKSKIMKALLVFGMSVVTATAMIGFTACNDDSGNSGNGGEGGNGGTQQGGTQQGGNNNGHTHEYDTAWSVEGEYHWKEPVCGDTTEKGSYGKHVDADDNNHCDDCNTEIAHKYATEWTKDANGHYYAATCDHTTLKDQEGPHVDAEDDNICDTCGYVGDTSDGYKAFVAAHESATKVVGSTFFVASKLPVFDDWGTAGLYASADNETHKVEISGGKANLITPNANPATNLYVDFGTATGIIEGYFDMSDFKNGVSGYTPVQFQSIVDGSAKEVFGLRADTNWKYRLNGGDAVALTDTIAVANCNVYFSYNSATGKLTVKINDKVVIEDHQLSTNLIGIKLATGDGNNKTFSIDNVLVVNTPLNLDAYKTALQTNATAAKAKILTGITVDTSEADSALTDGLAAATTNEECDTAYTTFYGKLVSAYKDGVIDKIDEDYPNASYTKTQNKGDYDAAIDALTDALAAAKTIEAVTAAYNTADGALKVIKVDSYYELQDYVVTVVNGKTDGNTLTVKDGDTVTKEQLDALVEIPDGKSVAKYTDAEGADITFPYTVNGNVNLTAVIDNASTDEGKYTFTVSGSADVCTTAEGSKGDASKILTSATSYNKADWKFASNTESLTLTFKVAKGQTVTLYAAGYSGSTGKDSGVNITASEGLKEAGTQELVLGSSATASSPADTTLTYTADTTGEVTITILRSKGNTARITKLELTIANSTTAE